MSTAATSANQDAVAELVRIFRSPLASSEERHEAIVALGRAGGASAVKELRTIYRSARTGGELKVVTIAALGEAGRTD